jgi:hypothetical protein
MSERKEMTEADVVALMKTSRDAKEWDANIEIVKEAFWGGYPSFWWTAMMMSGVAHNIQQSWMSEAASGLLPKTSPGEATVIHLKPPTPDEIAEITARKPLSNLIDRLDDKGKK